PGSDQSRTGIGADANPLGCGSDGRRLADSLWVYESNTTGSASGNLTDLLYAANALLIIVALVAGRTARPGDPGVAGPPGWLSRSLPLVPLVAAAIFMAPAPPDVVTESPVVVTGLLLIASLVLRQMLEAAELGKRERQVRTMADRLSGELASASKYVASTLPGDLDGGPVRIRSRYLPAREVSGDLFGYLWVDDDHLIVYSIDVSGRGVESALLSVSVHNMLRSGSMPATTLLAPEQVMTDFNRLFGMEGHDDHFFAMWFGVYQPSTRLLRYAVAGHAPALALAESHGAVTATPLGGTAVPIGMFPDTVFTADTHNVPAGAQILLWSDGVLGDRLSFAGFTELCEEVATAPGWSPASLVARLRATAGGSFDDDCVLVQLTF
ncbi:MAG: PP2C family protein-serine/threonine phosphatase, partial [Mycobacterium sp.]